MPAELGASAMGTPVRKSDVEPRQALREHVDEQQRASASSRMPIASDARAEEDRPGRASAGPAGGRTARRAGRAA